MVEQSDVARAPGLTGLPREILQNILSSVLHPQMLLHQARPNIAIELFTHPLLLTCRLLRKTCLEYISTTYIWITVHIPKCLSDSGVSSLPVLPTNLQHLVTENPPKIELKIILPERGLLHGIRGDFHSYNIPFVFEIALNLCGRLSQIAMCYEYLNCKLDIQFQHVQGNVLATVRQLFFPCLLNLHGFARIDSGAGDDAGMCEYVDYSLNVSEERWLVDVVKSRAEKILQAAMQLEQKDYVEEAGLLLLYTGWIEHGIQGMPASPYKWSPTFWSDDEMELCEEDSALVQQNQLRTILFCLEYAACLFFVQLWNKYGSEWCRTHDYAFHEPFVRFNKPAYPWRLGLSKFQRGKLHYGAGLVSQTLCKIAERDPDYRLNFQTDTWRDPEGRVHPLENMMMHAELAHDHDEQNVEFRRLFEECLTYENQHKVQQGRAQAKKNWYRKSSVGGGHLSFAWDGDYNILKGWDPGQDLEWYTQRAELGARVFSSAMEWFEKLNSDYLSQRFR